MGISVQNSGPAAQAGVFHASISRTAPGRHAAGNFRKKKHLNYNMREISTQIMRAAKVVPASQVLVRARGKVDSLERCRLTGQYDEKEVRAALAHAKRMVKCAKMKVNNLKDEERQKSRNQAADRSEKQQKVQEARRRVKTKKQELKRKAEQQMKLQMEGIEQVQRQKARNEMLMKKRRLNRIREQEKISDADLKYLQRDIGDEIEMNQPYSYTGAVFDASEQLISLASQLQQLEYVQEQEMQQEIQQNMAADPAMDSVPAADTGMAAESAAVPAGAESIDVFI